MLVNAGIFKKMFQLAKARGLYTQEKIESLSKELAEHEDMLPVFVAYEVFNPVIESPDWETIGTEMGSQMTPLNLGVLGYYLHACDDLFTAYQALVRYQALLSDVANFHVEPKRDEIHWYLITPMAYGFLDNRMMKVVSDLSMAYRHKTLEILIGSSLVPVSIEFVYPDTAPSWKKAQEKFFGCPASFGKKYNKIVYKARDVTELIPSRSKDVCRQLEPLLNKRVEELFGNRNQTQLVERLIRTNMGLMTCTLESIAFKLNMSARNLQRRLQLEGTKFQTILEDLQKEMALSMKKNGMVPKEIADHLGYRETNSFLRAFKRWFGKSFSEYSD